MQLRILTALLAMAPLLSAAEKEVFVPLFNGKDLTGWVPSNVHPSTFTVKNGEIVTTGRPIGTMRTERHYENFIIELEWMHVNTKEVGNSGLFLWGDPLPAVGTPFTRGIEVQVLVNLEKENAYTSHGDIFSIWGATCKPDRPHPMGWARCLPSERLCKGGGEWNHYRVVANNGSIKLSVNGKEVSGVSECKPRKGYICLESEGAECHFRNIKIHELPSTNPKPEEIADVARGHKQLFNGLDMAGWKKSDSWKVIGEKLKASGKDGLSTADSFETVELLFDYRIKGNGPATVKVGDQPLTFQAKGDTPAGVWTRKVFTWKDPIKGPIEFFPAEGLELMNLYVLEKK